MPILALSTAIHAPQERVFDLARSIDAHVDSTEGTSERAVAGVVSGLIGLNEEVTWEARHLGVRQRLTVRIVTFDRPRHFRDVMISGAFKSMIHDHTFAAIAEGTLMNDRFEFRSPFAILGSVVDAVFLGYYLRRFLIRRNQALKRLAESGDWSRYLEPKPGG